MDWVFIMDSCNKKSKIKQLLTLNMFKWIVLESFEAIVHSFNSSQIDNKLKFHLVFYRKIKTKKRVKHFQSCILCVSFHHCSLHLLNHDNQAWRIVTEIEMDTETQRKLCHLAVAHSTPTVFILRNTQTTQKRETVNKGEITTVNRWFGRRKQPILFMISLTYSLNNLEKHDFLFKTICASLFLTHWQYFLFI